MPYLIPLAGGALCLPLTYLPTRQGAFVITLAAIIVVALACSWASRRHVRRMGLAYCFFSAVAFVIGALASELALFAYHHFARAAPLKLYLVEGSAIATVGGIAVLVSCLAIRFIGTGSDAAR